MNSKCSRPQIRAQEDRVRVNQRVFRQFCTNCRKALIIKTGFRAEIDHCTLAQKLSRIFQPFSGFQCSFHRFFSFQPLFTMCFFLMVFLQVRDTICKSFKKKYFNNSGLKRFKHCTQLKMLFKNLNTTLLPTIYLAIIFS